MEDIDHEYTREITCPNCGDEQMDSWDFADEGDITCDECGKEFTYTRDIDITYVTKLSE